MITIYKGLFFEESDFVGYDIRFVDTFERITSNTRVLIVHYNFLSEILDGIKGDKLITVIVIDERYNVKHYMKVIQNDIKYYLPSNKKIGEQISLIVNMLFPVNDNSLEIDNQLNKIKVKNKIITLTSKEMLVFEYLNDNKNKLCLRKDILVDVLKYHPSSDSRIVDVYIRYLRIKLEEEGDKIKTIRGKGYIYEK